MSRRPTRSPRSEAFSQHRLRDQSVAQRIIASTGLAPPALVIEAGAGDGMLTVEITRHAGQVVAVEQDRDCYARLRQRFRDDPRVRTVLTDFIAFELPTSRPYSVISNVPFAITARLIRKLLEAPRPPSSSFLVLQHEAALQWTGDGGESVAGILAKLRFTFDITLALRRQDFVPWPRVNSVVLAIRRRPQPLLAGREAREFAALVERGFGRGRPSLRQNFGKAIQLARLMAAARELDFDFDSPPGELSFDQWLGLFRKVSRTRLPGQQGSSQ